MLMALIKGFAMSGSLIMAIGAQNAFVIRQGLTNKHLLLTALLCSVADALLILLGVFGFGTVIADFPLCMEGAKYCSIIFLAIYGVIALKSALWGKKGENSGELIQSQKKIIAVLLTLSFLNPHAYLDTVVLLGGIASQQPDHEQLYFAGGAIFASFAWFFSITYGSRFLAPLFQHPSSWKIVDGLVAVSMWLIAITLIFAL